VLCEAFGAASALLKHEVAYVLGQLQHPLSVPTLGRGEGACGQLGLSGWRERGESVVASLRCGSRAAARTQRLPEGDPMR
jgi:hypothetical protein